MLLESPRGLGYLCSPQELPLHRKMLGISPFWVPVDPSLSIEDPGKGWGTE